MTEKDLAPQTGEKKKEKRVGRGVGSGHGKTATKGHKGQRARSGGVKGPGFEGGQQPLIRRIPKRGFVNIFRKELAVINVGVLGQFSEKEVITPSLLKDAGLVRRSAQGIKVLGDGTLTKPLTIQAHKFSKGAREKIIAAGGKLEVIDSD